MRPQARDAVGIIPRASGGRCAHTQGSIPILDSWGRAGDRESGCKRVDCSSFPWARLWDVARDDKRRARKFAVEALLPDVAGY
jgi:hypothetical protein